MIDKILKLAEAGFTKEEIMTLVQAPEPAPAEPAAQEPTPAEPAAQEPTPTEPAAQQPAPAEPGAQSNELKEIKNSMEELINVMRANAINSSRQPATESVDDVLAQIINPTKNKG